MLYGIDMQLKQILEEDECREIVDKHLPWFFAIAGNNPSSQGLSLRMIAKYMKGKISDESLAAIDAELKVHGEARNWISPREVEKIREYQEIAKQYEDFKKIEQPTHHQDAIYPGAVWLDTKGEPIQAHAGGVFYENDTYYWYGENKEHTDGQTDIWSWGIRVYESKDLMNWTDLGLLIEPVIENPNSNLFPEKYVDRPHIVKNPNTGRYVCWIKISGPGACFVILTADKFLGPYTVEQENYNPMGNKIGDFDLVVAEDGTGYLIAESNHESTLTYRLSEDYLLAEEVVAESYPNLLPPFCREANSAMERNGKKYLITSGMTGYIPNQSDAAVANHWEEPFVSIGDPHVDDESLSSFNSQIGQIFKVPNRDLYITIADRWLGDRLLDRETALAVRNTVSSSVAPEQFSATEREKELADSLPATDQTATMYARYVWLPIEFEGDVPKIRWQDSWVPELS